MGIEPTFEAWEAPVLPLNYTRMDEVETVSFYSLARNYRIFITICKHNNIPVDDKPEGIHYSFST